MSDSSIDADVLPAIPAPPTAMSGRMDVLRRYGWLVSGTMYLAAVQWVILSLLARALNAESIGRYAYALAVTGPVYMFSNMQLAQVFASDAGRRYSVADYSVARVATALASLVVCIALGLLIADDQLGVLVVLIVGVAKCLEALGDIASGGAQRAGLVHRAAYSGLLRGTAMLVLVIVAAFVARSVVVVACAIALANLLTLPFDAATLRAAREREAGRGTIRLDVLRADWTRLRAMLLMALPLGIVAVAVNLIGTIPRIALREAAGLAELGRFAVLSYFILGARMIVIPMSNAVIPSLGAAFVAGRKRHFMELMGALLTLALVLGLGGYVGARLFGGRLLHALYGTEYASLAPELATLMIGAGLSYVATFCEDALTAVQDLRPKAVLVVSVAVATLVVGAPLVHRLGFRGAVLAVVLASGLEAVGSLLLLVRALCSWRPVT